MKAFLHLNSRMKKDGSALDFNVQFSPLLISILCDGEYSGVKMKATSSQCSWKPREWMFIEMFVYTLLCYKTTPGFDLFKLYFY